MGSSINLCHTNPASFFNLVDATTYTSYCRCSNRRHLQFRRLHISCRRSISINNSHHPNVDLEPNKAPLCSRRRGLMSTVVFMSGLVLLMEELVVAEERTMRPAQAVEAVPEQRWGTRSFMREKYFEPGLSPEEAAARIRQTTEGMRNMRHMLDTQSWRYVLFYVRLKSAYLDVDLKNALATVPEGRRKSYIQTANQVVDNMSELDRYVRSPKVYESYLYYEKTLKSLDELVQILLPA